MEVTANQLMLEAARKALEKSSKAPTREEQKACLKIAKSCLHAGLDEAWAHLDLMEGLGASIEARNKSFEMVLNGEI